MPVIWKEWLAVAISSAIFCLSLCLVVAMLVAPMGSWVLVFMALAVACRLAGDLRVAAHQLNRDARLAHGLCPKCCCRIDNRNSKQCPRCESALEEQSSDLSFSQ